MTRSVRHALVAAALLLAPTSFPVIAADMPDLDWCDKTGASAMNRSQAEHCAALWWWQKELAKLQREDELRRGDVRVLRGGETTIPRGGSAIR